MNFKLGWVYLATSTIDDYDKLIEVTQVVGQFRAKELHSRSLAWIQDEGYSADDSDDFKYTEFCHVTEFKKLHPEEYV